MTIKRNNSIYFFDVKHTVLLLIVFLLSVYSYGFKASFFGFIALYCIFIFIYNSRILYICLKNYILNNELITDKKEMLIFSITTILAIIGFCFLDSKIKIFVFSFSLIILLMLLIGDIIRKYTR
jgi:hypothetical protein